jgi:hypothetical protein
MVNDSNKIVTFIYPSIPKNDMNKQQIYVTMTDTVMSGWGKAEGKTNKYVLKCDSMETAQVVADNARHREEMKYVHISHRCPKDNDWRLVSLVDAKDTSFVIPGYFEAQEDKRKAMYEDFKGGY